ncbi:hypothetical protein [Leptolyngbya sp. KIOST-1]|uniref:hypothetical protein n=1 Tax=Leptolyngbya sp. KIOST-1 TaxID=1229172 RepID=UPI0005651BDF|nr:hypothetical protein [Leptolyngbya sp. KIOST-1]
MKNIKLWGSLVTAAVVTGMAGAASAQEVSTTAGFQLGVFGGVTGMTVSSAVSDTNAYSSGVVNSGGVFTEAIASTIDLSDLAGKPFFTEFGTNVNPLFGGTVFIAFPDGPGVIIP